MSLQSLQRGRRSGVTATVIAFLLTLIPLGPALAGTTGTISGTVTQAAGGPVANARVTATAPSGSQTTLTNGAGFYVLQGLIPDTYTISVQATGYDSVSRPGVTVQQDIQLVQDIQLTKQNLKEIGQVSSRSSSNLVRPNVTQDVYNVSGAQLNAATGGDNTHKTIYEYLATVPGVTGNGFPSQPRIHGANITDVAYEFDGIGIKDRITGFFTTNLSNIGLSNIEVYTGGLSAGAAASGAGIINSVVKTGTYPGFSLVSYGATYPDSNNYLTIERGGATENRRFSYYAAFDGVTSHNDYYNGQYTYPGVVYFGANGPGTVKTRDLIGNFHYRTNANNDFQFLIQNGVGEFVASYLLNRKPGEPQPLSMLPCKGISTATDPYGTGGTGGIAPNGAPCPAGFYFGSLTPGTGNITHHYSGIGKLQWNHIINDHSFMALRVAENFNQYIFDQSMAEPNIPVLENGANAPFNQDPGCAPAPYFAGAPIPVSNGSLCIAGNLTFFGDRRSEMYTGALDYTNTLSAQTTIHAGAGQEYDVNKLDYYNLYSVNADGSYPGISRISSFPTHIPYVYADIVRKVGKFTLQPGLRYQREYYDMPTGVRSVGLFNPTFGFTYQADPNDVIRGSYADSSSFVGTAYVFRQGGQGGYDPSRPGFSFNPTILHSADLMWEHQINPSTSVKFGPWYNTSSNIFQLYRPITGYKPTGQPIFGKAIPSNGGIRKAFGFEFALNHLDNRSIGTSYWLSATYDNFWTNMTSSLYGNSYAQATLPANIYQSGTLIRSPDNPLLNASLVADFHSGRFSFLPTIAYQYGTFYNVGVLSCYTACPAGKQPQISQPEQMAGGSFKVNATILERLGPKENYVVGIRASNLTDNTNDTTPCKPGNVGYLYGCYGVFAASPPNVGGPPGSYQYQNYTQNPFRLEFFFTEKI